MHSFVAYIDESGDEGFVFRDGSQSGGSSNWLVLSAIVVRTPNDKRLPRLRKELMETMEWRKKKKVFHFRNLSHPRRVNLVRGLASFPLRAVTVLIHKPSIAYPDRFSDSGRLYHYAVRLLLERISWLCAEKRAPGDGDGTIDLRFEHRRATSYSDLRSYLQRLKAMTDEGEDVRVDWSVIRPDQVGAFPKDRYFGLQAADAVAGAFYQGLEPNRSGWVEGRYCEELTRICYRRGQRVLSHGVKVWPPDAETWLAQHPELSWFQRCFPR